MGGKQEGENVDIVEELVAAAIGPDEVVGGASVVGTVVPPEAVAVEAGKGTPSPCPCPFSPSFTEALLLFLTKNGSKVLQIMPRRSGYF